MKDKSYHSIVCGVYAALIAIWSIRADELSDLQPTMAALIVGSIAIYGVFEVLTINFDWKWLCSGFGHIIALGSSLTLVLSFAWVLVAGNVPWDAPLPWNTICSIGLSIASGFCLLVATKSVSREKELSRRKKKGNNDLSGLVIGDGEKKYDLGGTLLHQGKWTRIGTALAILAVVVQVFK